MADTTRKPTVAELLEETRRTVFQPDKVVRLTAVQVGGLFDSVPEGTPEGEVAADAMAELAPDRDGWSVDADRRWTTEAVPGVALLVRPGKSLEHVLAQLDRIRAELVANPGLLEEDWNRPLQRRPALRVVRGRGQE